MISIQIFRFTYLTTNSLNLKYYTGLSQSPDFLSKAMTITYLYFIQITDYVVIFPVRANLKCYNQKQILMWLIFIIHNYLILFLLHGKKSIDLFSSF